jgi:protein SCO1/2
LSTEPSNTRLILLTALIAALSVMAGYSLWRVTSGSPPALQTLIVLPEPRDIPEFSLTDQNGAPFELEQLRGAWSLLFFGFTHCPDVCPNTLYELKNMRATILEDDRELADRIQVVLVSVDPERDSPEKLREYVAYFDPSFLGVTGPDEEMLPLTRKLGIAYRIDEHEAGEKVYNVDHSASILLIDPNGRLYGVFPAPHEAAVLAEDLRAILD